MKCYNNHPVFYNNIIINRIIVNNNNDKELKNEMNCQECTQKCILSPTSSQCQEE